MHIGALYRKYAPDVFRFALHLCGEQSDAEDIVSETFARVLLSPAPVVAETVKGYLLTIARNLYLQRRRTESRHVSLDDAILDLRTTAPELATEQRDEIRRAEDRLGHLSAIDRATFWMRVEGVSYDEIAATLGVSVAAARVKVHRARRLLAGIR